MALGDKLPVVMGKEKAVANGVATLGADGKLAKAQRPTPTEAGSADLTLSNLSNRQMALRNIGGRPNRNLLDNWYFVGGGSQQGGGQFPINQRGQTSYASGNVIDRWQLSGNGGQSLIIDTDGITLTSTAEYGLYFTQTPDQSVIDACLGKTVTVSVISVGQNTANLSLNLYVDSAWTDYMGIQEGINSKQFAIPSTANSFYFSFGASAAGACKLIAAKLELGPTQTLAYQDESGAWQLFETPDYGEELDKCLFYLEIQNIPINAFISANVWNGSTGECSFCLQYANKRITPTISFSGGGRFVPNSASPVNLTSFFTKAATPSAAGISATLSENLTGGGAGWVDSLGQVIISAEL